MVVGSVTSTLSLEVPISSASFPLTRTEKVALLGGVMSTPWEEPQIKLAMRAKKLMPRLIRRPPAASIVHEREGTPLALKAYRATGSREVMVGASEG